jgi:predicted nucleic acid-binding protein
MEVIVDTSVWIDYFRSGSHSEKLDFLLDENLVIINDLILSELLPLLLLRNEKKVVNLLKMIKCYTIKPNWPEIIDYQVLCLKSGANGIGIPDLLIAQNCIQNDTPIYSLDKHFTFMHRATIDIELFS